MKYSFHINIVNVESLQYHFTEEKCRAKNLLKDFVERQLSIPDFSLLVKMHSVVFSLWTIQFVG